MVWYYCIGRKNEYIDELNEITMMVLKKNQAEKLHASQLKFGRNMQEKLAMQDVKEKKNHAE